MIMMRNAIAAALILSPLMVHAQANTPAQPQAATNAPVLQSSLAEAKGMMLASASAGDRPTAGAAVRVSTGVISPKLVHTVDIEPSTVSVASLAGVVRTAAVSMVVDETGKPTNLKITQSAGPDLDQNILAAVSQYRFNPGTVSGMKIAFPVNLNLNIMPAGE
jgi:TonB family protein